VVDTSAEAAVAAIKAAEAEDTVRVQVEEAVVAIPVVAAAIKAEVDVHRAARIRTVRSTTISVTAKHRS
jgi:hypothetical protein